MYPVNTKFIKSNCLWTRKKRSPSEKQRSLLYTADNFSHSSGKWNSYDLRNERKVREKCCFFAVVVPINYFWMNHCSSYIIWRKYCLCGGVLCFRRINEMRAAPFHAQLIRRFRRSTHHFLTRKQCVLIRRRNNNAKGVGANEIDTLIDWCSLKCAARV